VVIVAGGIGLAPLRPAMVALVRDPDRFGAITLLVGARDPDELLYLEDLDAWGATPHAHVAVTVDRASPDWRGEVGVVTRLIARHRFEPDATVALVCGPEIMMRFAARALVDQGIAPGAIRLSMERNMHCAIAQCGHCQLGPEFLCREGPVLPYARLEPLMQVPEL
jgi:NAD(P)H-flavin reductase